MGMAWVAGGRAQRCPGGECRGIAALCRQPPRSESRPWSGMPRPGPGINPVTTLQSQNMEDLIMVEMRRYHFIAYFFGGAFPINSVPHLVAGVSGSPLRTPFASPPGEGLSSSPVNVLWATFTGRCAKN